ncbi:MAG: N-acetyltransferase [Salaquimonas sp.]
MLCNKITIRSSVEADAKMIRKVERKAFGRKSEANLVDMLIPAPEFTISLVAECDGEIIGHVLMTEIRAPAKSLALAPLAVVSKYREMQVGSELVRSALKIAKEVGFEAVFVLGDLGYYERFGFSSQLADPFEVEWQGKQFMALELKDGALRNKKGPLNYPEPFFNL